MKNPPQSSVSQAGLTCIEICSGAGGQALGLERAGFARSAKCRVSSDQWKRAFGVVEGDVRDFSAKEFKGVDLLAGGVSSLSVGFYRLKVSPFVCALTFSGSSN
jgi:hypothetical protein